MNFLKTLMFTHQHGKELSLLDMCGDMHIQCGLQIRKQSIHERFNGYAVAFMKGILGKLLESEVNRSTEANSLTAFNRIRIKDSTRFTLPADYVKTYAGTGGFTANSESIISIQYEYDLLSGSTLDLRLTTGTRNDQLDAKENTHDIAENDLFIRDLGYSTTSYLRQIINGKAYFLNRLSSQTGVYDVDKNNEGLDFSKVLKKIKRYNLPYLEYNVVIGRDARLPCRLIICPVDPKTYKSRLHRTSKAAKNHGYKVTEDFKCKAQLNLYITNAPEDKLPASVINRTYGLRWQIELLFKIWKSQGAIDKVKGMRIQRFECQLLAKLIWLIIHRRIFQFVQAQVNDRQKGNSCSVWKYYKHSYRLNASFRTIMTKPNKLITLLCHLVKIAINQFSLEEKKGKTSHFKAVIALA